MKTVIDVDDEALEQAKQVLGTTTKVDTVNAALRRVAESPRRGAQLLAALEAAHVFDDYENSAASGSGQDVA